MPPFRFSAQNTQSAAYRFHRGGRNAGGKHKWLRQMLWVVNDWFGRGDKSTRGSKRFAESAHHDVYVLQNTLLFRDAGAGGTKDANAVRLVHVGTGAISPR